MKIIYTSNYARNGNHPMAVAISRKAPDYYHGDHYSLLSPTWELIMDHKNKQISNKQYEVKYIRLLKERGINPQELVDAIPNNTILLCYESPTDFCHRHVLAQWLNSNADVCVVEWKNNKELIEDKQQKLIDSLLQF